MSVLTPRASVFLRTRVAPYAFAAIITTTIALWFLHPWLMPATHLFSGGEDIAGLQTGVTEAAQVGPFGTDPHIAYPMGDNLWSFPQWGLAILTGGWLLAGVAGVGSGPAILWMMAGALIATSCSVLFMFRSVIGQRCPWLAAALAAALACSPFFLISIGHLNVATVFIVPMGLGIVLRDSYRSRRRWIGAALAVAVAAAISPIWWVIVLILILAAVAVGVVLQRSWRRLIAMALVGFGALAGLTFQYLLVTAAAVSGQEVHRTAWSSNIYSGKLSDVFIASPFVNAFVPRTQFQGLRHGASAEFTPLGITCAVALIALILLLVKQMPRFVKVGGQSKDRLDTNMLAVISTVVVLYYFVGGLSNIQAALFAFTGTGSPARTFSRMAILMAALGMAWFLVYFSRWHETTRLQQQHRTYAGAAVGAMALVLTIVDLNAVPLPVQSAPEDMSEYPALSYIQANTRPCPVAQLPQDSAPANSSGLVPASGTDAGRALINATYHYRGYYSYLLAPDYFWSIGSFHRHAKTALNDLGTTLTPSGAKNLNAAGFCAVLFDKQLATRPAKFQLGGYQIQGMPMPNFTSPRYDVYLLAAPPK